MSAAKLSRWLLVAGVVLFLVAAVWPYVLPGSALYDDSQAIELNKAAESLHETMHAHGHGHDHDHFGEEHGDDHPEVAAAAQHYREAQSELDSAKFWTAAVPTYVRWSGIAVCVIGIVIYFVGRRI